MYTVDKFEQIRRRFFVDGLSQRAIAEELGLARKTVAKAIRLASPAPYQLSKPRRRPTLEPFQAFIDAWREQDQSRPHKQRHTGQRIFERLRDEQGYQGSYSSVSRYLARVGQGQPEVFMPLEFGPGEEAQVDWGEGHILDNGVDRKVQFFCMRLCYSKAAFLYPYERASLEAFLDGHVRAFGFFGGVPRRLAYDNLKAAVLAVGRGQERRLNQHFMELRSHYLFASRFCNVASGHEKGLVENLVKLLERSLLTPLPEVTELGSLAGHLLEQCRLAPTRTLGRDGRVQAELLAEERATMLPLPASPFAACRRESVTANKQLLIRFDNNDYSVPMEYAYRACQVRGFVDRVEIACDAAVIAVHVRSYGRGDYVLEPWHYLRVLQRKPGSLDNARPFKGVAWGADLTRMRSELEYRYGGAGTKKYIAILMLLLEHSLEEVQGAVRDCVARCVFSDSAVRSLLRAEPPAVLGRLDLSARPELQQVGTGLRPAGLYDQLCVGEEVPA